MKRLSVAVFALLAVGCCHTYNMDIQGHTVTQLRTWDLLGPSTVGFYEDIDGKLTLHQEAAGSNVGEIAVGLGTGYAGERIGDGLKHQEAEQTNIQNEATGGASESLSEGGAGGAGGEGGAGGRAYGGSANSVSGAAAGSVSNSSSTGFRGYKPKPSVTPVSVKKPTTTNQSVSVRNTINNP